MNMPVQDLRGPNADEACRLLSKAFRLTSEQATHVSRAYEIDDQNYGQYCTEVWNALERTGRLLPLGWFEAIFLDCAWVNGSKALHAVADAVMATLVRQDISGEAYQCLTRPFLCRNEATVVAGGAKVDLINVPEFAATL
jgi:hypothetical protein